MTGTREESALGAARDRFVEGLPRKVAELRTAIDRFAREPDHGPTWADLRRRLGALHASAQVFRFEELAATLTSGLASLDAPAASSPGAAEHSGVDVARLGSLVDALERFASTHAPSSPPAATLVGIGMPSKGANEAPTRPGDLASVAPTPVLGTTAPRASVPPTGGGNAARAAVAAVDTVILVLVVGQVAKKVAAALPRERFEIMPAEPRDALIAARVGAPDLVLVGEDIVSAAGSTLVTALRGDAMTDLVPILLVATDSLPNEGIARRFGVDDVVPASLDGGALAAKIARLSGLLPTSRAAELGTRSLREVAERMADELRRGLVESAERGVDEPLAFGDGTELFAAVWAAIARMRTSVVDRSGGRVRFREAERRGGPSWLSLGSTEARPQHAPDVALHGRRILVADDDPAVRWFFVGLLQDAGADVLEAPDGRAALELARRSSPDLVITDILMPQLDGLSLSRELARDPSLAEVPVIFLSWKEDYLHRMRELRAGAAGYLLKEEGAAVILDHVRDAFRPRVRFEERLRDGGEVRGRIEGLGVLSIVRSVARIRKDARVTIRDVYNLFEIDVRRGRIVELVRTSSDGSFGRGERALGPLLGVTAGRFAVLAPTLGDKPGHAPIGSELIEQEAERLGALIDAVSGRGLAMADHVELDADVVASLLPISPPPIVDVVRRLKVDASARRWLGSGEIEPEVLAGALVELARRGAVVAVRGDHGEDRVAEALVRRRGGTPVPTGSRGASPSTPPPSAEEPLPTERTVDDEDQDEPEISFDASSVDVSSEIDRESAPLADTMPIRTSEPELVDDSVVETLDTPSSPASLVLPAAAEHPVDPELARLRQARKRREGPDDTLKLVRHPETEPSPGPVVGVWVFLGLLLVAGAMVGLGYLASRKAPTAPAAGEVPGRAASSNATPAELGSRSVDPPSEDPQLYGERVTAGSTVLSGLPAGQGALAVESIPSGTRVELDGRPVASLPIAVEPGWHRLVLRSEDETSVRFVPIRAGQARRFRLR